MKGHIIVLNTMAIIHQRVRETMLQMNKMKRSCMKKSFHSIFGLGDSKRALQQRGDKSVRRKGINVRRHQDQN